MKQLSNILHVDNDFRALLEVRQVFGKRVVSCSDEASGLALARRHDNLDLILLEVAPVRGHTLTRMISRFCDARPGAAIVILTRSPTVYLRAVKNGALAVVWKEDLYEKRVSLEFVLEAAALYAKRHLTEYEYEAMPGGLPQCSWFAPGVRERVRQP
jgi:hypothetical protein